MLDDGEELFCCWYCAINAGGNNVRRLPQVVPTWSHAGNAHADLTHHQVCAFFRIELQTRISYLTF
jgi:hypothetical protein